MILTSIHLVNARPIEATRAAKAGRDFAAASIVKPAVYSRLRKARGRYLPMSTATGTGETGPASSQNLEAIQSLSRDSTGLELEVCLVQCVRPARSLVELGSTGGGTSETRKTPLPVLTLTAPTPKRVAPALRRSQSTRCSGVSLRSRMSLEAGGLDRPGRL